MSEEKQSWAEAVLECVSDSAERERLIRMYEYDELVKACLALGTLALTAKHEAARNKKLEGELADMTRQRDYYAAKANGTPLPEGRMDSEPPKDAIVGYFVEFNRGWWARSNRPHDHVVEKSQSSGHYAGNITEDEAKDLEQYVENYLGRRGWPDGDAQAEIMRGGRTVKITVGGSSHVRSIREWHGLAVASFAKSASTSSPDTERMDWLERMVVEARQPLVHGSAFLFLTSPKAVEGADDEPSNIRAHIDYQRRGGDAPNDIEQSR